MRSMKETGVTQEEAETWIREHYQSPNEATALQEILDEKCVELDVPGHIVEFDPGEAELCGAFVEDALSEENALDAAMDQEA